MTTKPESGDAELELPVKCALSSLALLREMREQ